MSTKSYPRSRRIGDQIQRALSELIRREVKDPRLGIVTLTEVQVSKDLAYATVFYSMLTGDAALTQEILEHAAPYLRGPLGRSLGSRHSPELRFKRDELIEKGARMSELINTAVKQDQARHSDDDNDRDP